MQVIESAFDVVKHIAIRPFEDDRGVFNKFLMTSDFEEHGLMADFRESYYTTSRKGVVRGMHFQIPPCEHAKLITIISGEILDVVLDLRRKSGTFGQAASFFLSVDKPSSVYIPAGFAHGFAALSDCTVLYNVTSEHSLSCDAGVRWNSFGFEWPFDNPLLSDRDQRLDLAEDFQSPF
jgi:dTDP-4-dehydrorhamnose 3,5-epimerase